MYHAVMAEFGPSGFQTSWLHRKTAVISSVHASLKHDIQRQGEFGLLIGRVGYFHVRRSSICARPRSSAARLHMVDKTSFATTGTHILRKIFLDDSLLELKQR